MLPMRNETAYTDQVDLPWQTTRVRITLIWRYWAVRNRLVPVVGTREPGTVRRTGLFY
jgi:hypothetical protein